MDKLLQILVCGLAAVSFSVVAADKKSEADAKAGATADMKKTDKKKGKAASGGTKADTKASTDAKDKKQ